MGYKHYWRHPQGTDTDFGSFMPAIMEDVKAILYIAKEHVTGPEGMQGTRPIITTGDILFNGIEPYKREAFCYPPLRSSGGDLMDACETGREFYDAAVVASLLAIKFHMGSAITLETDADPTSSGDCELMIRGVALYALAFPDRKDPNWPKAFNCEVT